MSNVFVIESTAGELIATLKPGTLNGPGSGQRSSDLYLYGMGSLYWGQGVDNNIYRLTENFACPPKVTGDHLPVYLGGTVGANTDYVEGLHPLAPKDEVDLSGVGRGVTNPVAGQTWFNTESGKLHVWNPEGTWDSVGGVVTSPSTTQPENPGPGDLWYNTTEEQLQVHVIDTTIEYTITGVNPATDTWIIDGNHASEFNPGDTFTVWDNTGSTSRTYTVVSATDVGSETEIVVEAGTIPVSATADGSAYRGHWDSVADNYLRLDGTVPATGNLDMGTHSITNVVDPSNPQDAATMNYVDTEVNNILTGGALDGQYVRIVGDTMNTSAVLAFATHLWINEGGGNVAAGPDIRMGTDGLTMATVDLHYMVDSDNNGSGAFKVHKGSTAINGSEQTLFTVRNDGRLRVDTANYETLVAAANDIPNKKYVDDEIAAATGSLPSGGDHIAQVWTTLSSSAAAGDIAISGGKIYINLSAGANWKQVWPAIYS